MRGIHHRKPGTARFHPLRLISRMYLQSYARGHPVRPGRKPADRCESRRCRRKRSPTPRASDSSIPRGVAAAGNELFSLCRSIPFPCCSFHLRPTPAQSRIRSHRRYRNARHCRRAAGGNAVSLGGGRTAVYTLTNLTINPPLPAGDPPPPIVWRKNTSNNDKTAQPGRSGDIQPRSKRRQPRA